MAVSSGSNTLGLGAANLAAHALRPARGGALAVVLVFSALFSIATKAGLFGLPLALILSSWFYKYAFILFDQVSRGFDDPPVLDIQMMNPLNEQRPIGQVIIMGMTLAGVIISYSVLGPLVSSAVGAACLLLMPAQIAVLGLEGNIIRAANPYLWMRMAVSLGSVYLIVLGFIAVEAVVIALLSKIHLWIFFRMAIGMFSTLSVFSLLAGALYERRDHVGVETWTSPERIAAVERHEDLKKDQAVVTEAYGLVRAREYVKAWELLQTWLGEHDHNPDAYRWLCDRTESWDDSRYVTRLTQELVEKLQLQKRTGEALDAVAARLKTDAAFRPKSAADTLAIAQLAARGGGAPKLARTLLSDFAARFPGDPRVAVAATLAEHLQA